MMIESDIYRKFLIVIDSFLKGYVAAMFPNFLQKEGSEEYIFTA
jgi:hypothetical protein